jgi:hypothetical protein
MAAGREDGLPYATEAGGDCGHRQRELMPCFESVKALLHVNSLCSGLGFVAHSGMAPEHELVGL